MSMVLETSSQPHRLSRRHPSSMVDLAEDGRVTVRIEYERDFTEADLDAAEEWIAALIARRRRTLRSAHEVEA